MTVADLQIPITLQCNESFTLDIFGVTVRWYDVECAMVDTPRGLKLCQSKIQLLPRRATPRHSELALWRMRRIYTQKLHIASIALYMKTTSNSQK